MGENGTNLPVNRAAFTRKEIRLVAYHWDACGNKQDGDISQGFMLLSENSPRSCVISDYFHHSLWLWPEIMVQPCWFILNCSVHPLSKNHLKFFGGLFQLRAGNTKVKPKPAFTGGTIG